jgi:hypothetical protein
MHDVTKIPQPFTEHGNPAEGTTTPSRSGQHNTTSGAGTNRRQFFTEAPNT